MNSEPITEHRSETTLRVNGEPHTLRLDHRRVLLDVLREDLGLTGAKKGFTDFNVCPGAHKSTA
jgi:xanthine dehydrogenase YagT iron-sulfur-binding subunit